MFIHSFILFIKVVELRTALFWYCQLINDINIFGHKKVRRCKKYLTSTFCHLMDKNRFVATYEKMIRNVFSVMVKNSTIGDKNVIQFLKKFNYIAKWVLSTNRNTFGTFWVFCCIGVYLVNNKTSYPEEQPKQNSLLFHAMWSAIQPIEKQNLHFKRSLQCCLHKAVPECAQPGKRRARKRGKSRICQSRLVNSYCTWLAEKRSSSFRLVRVDCIRYLSQSRPTKRRSKSKSLLLYIF